MSVDYIRQLKRRIAVNSKAKQPFSLPYFVDGFSNCVREMQNYTLLEKWSADMREYNSRLTSHLTARLQLFLNEPIMKYQGIPASLPWDYVDANSVCNNNPGSSNYQQTTIVQPSTFQILNYTSR
uniref:Uncharacterized protein n=1 Tax=Loa loa TaxID=7209 RepID=A0A1I7VVX5_LOALO